MFGRALLFGGAKICEASQSINKERKQKAKKIENRLENLESHLKPLAKKIKKVAM